MRTTTTPAAALATLTTLCAAITHYDDSDDRGQGEDRRDHARGDYMSKRELDDLSDRRAG